MDQRRSIASLSLAHSRASGSEAGRGLQFPRAKYMALGGNANGGTSFAASAARPWFKGRARYGFSANPPPSLRWVWHNWRINASDASPESDGIYDTPMTKVYQACYTAEGALVGTGAIVTAGGIRNFTIPARALEFFSDEVSPGTFGLMYFPVGGFIDCRAIYTLPETQTAQVRGATSYAPGGSQGWRMTPSGGDDVDGTGVMTVAGGVDVVPTCLPVSFIGPEGFVDPSIVMASDSFGFRQNDITGQIPPGRGGYLRRAATAVGLPYFMMAIGGRTARMQMNSPRCASIYSRFTAMHIAPSFRNDTAFGQDAETVIIPAVRAISLQARSAGITNIILSNATPCTREQGSSSINYYMCTDPAQMTPFPTQFPGGVGFGPGEQKDRLNSTFLPSLETERFVDTIFNFAYFCQDPVETWKWNTAGLFTATLQSPISAGVASISLSVAPSIGDPLVFEPGSASNFDGTGQGGPFVWGVTGSGPYTVALTVADAYAGSTYGTLNTKGHTAGSTVKSTRSNDGDHATSIVHAAAASALQPIYAAL